MNSENTSNGHFEMISLQTQTWADAEAIVIWSSLSLAKAIEIVQSVEAAERNTLKLKAGGTGEVLRISPRRNKKPEKKEVCYRCGNKGHQPGECCYKDAKCHKCHKVGHLAKVC